MIKQSVLEHIKDSTHSVVHPIYKEKNACTRVSTILDYNFAGQIDKSAGVVTKINTLGKTEFQNLYFIGMGYQDEATSETIKIAFAKGLNQIDEDHLVIDAKRCITSTIDFNTIAESFTTAAILSKYNYKKASTQSYEIIASEDITSAIKIASIEANAINAARTLANTPSNQLNPLDIESYAKDLFKDEPVEIDALDNKRLEEIGAGGILGVNQGSDIEARLIILKYNGNEDGEYTALVGKGVTFDTGGYNIKSSMGNMKSDMHGSASVISAFEVIVKNRMKANVYCIISSTENMINGSAFKADDVLTMLSGKTVEVTNTDAEGRLVLADAITYAQRNLGVKRIIDVATLTGACVVALGGVHTGVWSNDEDFYSEFVEATKISQELSWRMPLHSVFNDVLKNSVTADMVNSAGPRGGGANVAAGFIQEFVEEGTKWIHLDIAGSSSAKEKQALCPTGSTGVMVSTLASLFK